MKYLLILLLLIASQVSASDSYFYVSGGFGIGSHKISHLNAQNILTEGSHYRATYAFGRNFGITEAFSIRTELEHNSDPVKGRGEDLINEHVFWVKGEVRF